MNDEGKAARVVWDYLAQFEDPEKVLAELLFYQRQRLGSVLSELLSSPNCRQMLQDYVHVAMPWRRDWTRGRMHPERWERKSLFTQHAVVSIRAHPWHFPETREQPRWSGWVHYHRLVQIIPEREWGVTETQIVQDVTWAAAAELLDTHLREGMHETWIIIPGEQPL